MHLQQRSTSCARRIAHRALPRRGGPVRFIADKDNLESSLGGQGRRKEKDKAIALDHEFPPPEVLKLGEGVEKTYANMVTSKEFKEGTEGLATKDDVAMAVTTATAGLATKEEVAKAVATATAGLATTEDVEAAVTTAFAGLVTKEAVAMDVSAAVTTGLAANQDVSAAVTTGLAAKEEVATAVAVVTAVEAKLASKEEVVKAQVENNGLTMAFYMLLTAVASAATMYTMVALKIVKAG